jgi:hypothetical protein
VIEWIQARKPPLRYLIYVAGTLLVFLVAVGAGAAAALVLSRPPERLVSGFVGPAETSTLEDTFLKMPGNAKPLERTVSEAPRNTKAFERTASETTSNPKSANPREHADETTFVHRATGENSRGDYTYIGNPRINGDPDAVVLASPIQNRGQTEATSYAHNIGVWYAPMAKKWAIFNQDLAAMTSGTTFEVVIPRTTEAFVHRAAPSNTISNSTYLDNPLTNGEPGALLSVTQNWNPGGVGGVYNDHAISVLYDRYTKKWLIYNKDGVPMPNGAACNVAVS